MPIPIVGVRMIKTGAGLPAILRTNKQQRRSLGGGFSAARSIQDWLPPIVSQTNLGFDIGGTKVCSRSSLKR
jgi:hypothetical protein